MSDAITQRRPFSVTLLAWCLMMVMGILLVHFTVLLALLWPWYPAFPIRPFVYFIVPIIAAVGMLKGRNWARYLFVLFVFYQSMFWVYNGEPTTVKILTLAILWMFSGVLFESRANTYFRKNRL